MNQKNTFKIILTGFAILLILLPPFAALNAFLTHFLDSAKWYEPIQRYIVPTEARLVATTLLPLGIHVYLLSGSKIATMYLLKYGAAVPIDLQWNCLGWQSALLLIISLIAGLRGQFTFVSRIKCILFGLFGTLLINILRMSFIAAGIYYVNSIFGMIVHDYVAAFLTLLWLLFFWWFSYSYLLESKLD